MTNINELRQIRLAEHAAFKRKQIAWQAFSEARELTRRAYDIMQSAWLERCDARDKMNHEYEAAQFSDEHHREVWSKYQQIRKENNEKIEALRTKSNSAHMGMNMCQTKAHQYLEEGKTELAEYYTKKKREYRKERDGYNTEISELCLEIKEARQEAEWQAPRSDSPGLVKAQTIFNQKKEIHDLAREEFKQLKTNRDNLQSDFEDAKREHERLKEEYRERLQELYMDYKTDDGPFDLEGTSLSDLFNE